MNRKDDFREAFPNHDQETESGSWLVTLVSRLVVGCCCLVLWAAWYYCGGF